MPRYADNVRRQEQEAAARHDEMQAAREAEQEAAARHDEIRAAREAAELAAAKQASYEKKIEEEMKRRRLPQPIIP